jgi:hypothetical protein
MYTSATARSLALGISLLALAACSGGAATGPSVQTPSSPSQGGATSAPGGSPTTAPAGGSSSAPVSGSSAAPAGGSTPAPTPTPTSGTTTTSTGKIGHVWLIVEENESESSTFGDGANSEAPYLSNTLKNQGAYLENYYATGHVSLDNYIALTSGQPPAPETTSDCTVGFNNFNVVTTNMTTGVAVGDGCVYPTSIKSIGDQLSAENISWKSYDEDMGFDATRDNTVATPFACGHPTPGTIGSAESDPTQSEEAADAYATRHNPFMYFHSIIDTTSGAAACANHVQELGHYLASDLSSIATTPRFSFITPDLCDDGHDSGCATMGADGTVGGLPGLDAYLKNALIPTIEASPAYKQDGLIIITFDEAATTDVTSCCNELTSAGSPSTGGGVVGAVLLSPFIVGPVVDTTSYNHYSTLHSIEDYMGVTQPTINGTPYLGYASEASDFATKDFNNITTTTTNANTVIRHRARR